MTEIIDAHHHLWHYVPEDYGWISLHMSVLRQDFLPETLRLEKIFAGVAGSVVVQARQTLEETEWLLGFAEQDPTICGVVGWLPLTELSLSSRHYQLRSNPHLKGVRHVIQDELDDNFILRKDFNQGIASLVDTGLVYDILIQERHLPQAAMFVRNHPHQIFVLDHLAKPRIREGILEPWKSNLARLAESPNVFCKLSGLVTEADWQTWSLDDLLPYLNSALEIFGASRLMAGSDWPVCLLASSYQRWWATLAEWMADFAPANASDILNATARKVYRL